MTHDVRIVIFDLGRVLMRICDDWKHACAQAGIDAPTGELDSTANAGLLEVVKRSEVGAIDTNTFCELAAPFLKLRPEHVLALSDAYLIGPYPGVNELLDDVHAKGIKTACLSNTNENHWRQMTDPSHRNALPLARLDYRFASQLMKLRKPDDAIYAAVERETGLAGNQIVFFDDLSENVASAKNRSWNAIKIEIDDDPVAQVRKHLKSLAIL
jgi:2-haloacid dehalogenase